MPTALLPVFGQIGSTQRKSRKDAFAGRTTKPTVEIVFSRVRSEDRAAIQELIDRVTREVENWNLEHRLLMPDAVVKHLHAIAHPVHDDATGGTEYVDGVMAVTGAEESRQALESAYVEIQSLMDRLQSENIVLREEIDQTSMFEQIVGVSPPLRTVLSQVSKVAPTDSTVLISGETGTGKELIARAIHKRSSRSARAFVAVNCAAIPSSLIASELFGHEKGAFTGALQRRQGRLRAGRRRHALPRRGRRTPRRDPDHAAARVARARIRADRWRRRPSA